MKFCDCGNRLVAVVTTVDAYHECTVCKKRAVFEEGDTLIKPPAIKPTGIDKVAHILRGMKYKNQFRTVDDKPCPDCGYKYAKVLMDDEIWYACMAPECDNTYQ